MPRAGEAPPNAFPAKNTAARKHGIWSRRTVDPLARELAEGLIEERPDLEQYPETVWAWSRAEARCILMADWLADNEMIDTKGKPAPVMRFVSQFERLAASLRQELGLTPKSEADIVTSRAEATMHAFDIESLRAKGREIMRARS